MWCTVLPLFRAPASGNLAAPLRPEISPRPYAITSSSPLTTPPPPPLPLTASPSSPPHCAVPWILAPASPTASVLSPGSRIARLHHARHTRRDWRLVESDPRLQLRHLRRARAPRCNDGGDAQIRRAGRGRRGSERPRVHGSVGGRCSAGAHGVVRASMRAGAGEASLRHPRADRRVRRHPGARAAASEHRPMAQESTVTALLNLSLEEQNRSAITGPWQAPPPPRGSPPSNPSPGQAPSPPQQSQPLGRRPLLRDNLPRALGKHSAASVLSPAAISARPHRGCRGKLPLRPRQAPSPAPSTSASASDPCPNHLAPWIRVRIHALHGRRP